MLNRLLFRLTSGLPCRLINLDSGRYLERYYLGCVLGVTFYLHRFVSSDSERHTHNHPWKWGGALILSGGYTEERLVDLCPHLPEGHTARMIRRRWFNVVNGNTFHRIHAAKPGTWTLFFHGARELVPVYAKGDPRPCQPAMVAKGWGFIERERMGPEHVSIFIPYPSANSEWWLDAPTGANVGRAPL